MSQPFLVCNTDLIGSICYKLAVLLKLFYCYLIIGYTLYIAENVTFILKLIRITNVSHLGIKCLVNVDPVLTEAVVLF